MYYGLYLLSLLMESILAKSPIQTGISFLPLTLVLCPTAIITGQLITYFGRYRHLLWISWIVLIGDSIALIFWDHSTPTVAWVFMLLFAGVGHGMFLSCATVTLQCSVDAKDVGEATAMGSFAGCFGQSLGPAIVGVVLENRLGHFARQMGLSDGLATDVQSTISSMQLSPPVRTAFEKAFQNMFEINTAVCVLGLLISLGVKNYRLDQTIASAHVLEQSDTVNATAVAGSFIDDGASTLYERDSFFWTPGPDGSWEAMTDSASFRTYRDSRLSCCDGLDLKECPYSSPGHDHAEDLTTSEPAWIPRS